MTTRQIRALCWTVLIALAALQGWVFRHTVSPDGISYLDLSDAVVNGRWGELVNGYWSPLYPVLIGLARLAISQNPYWEFAVVHLVNFLGFVAALAAFEWFLVALDEAGTGWGQRPFATPLGRAVAYAFFGGLTLLMVTVEATTPDLWSTAATFAAFACLLRLRLDPRDTRSAVFLGIALGVGALSKSFFFPLSGVVFLTLAVATFGPQAMRAAGLAVGAFALITLPWCIPLSLSLGKVSTGESGGLNYAWWVNDIAPPQSGVMPASAAPRDSLPLSGLAVMPGAKGTNPLWYDPVRWHRSTRPHFDAGRQIKRIEFSAGYYIGLMAPLLFVVVTITSGSRWRDLRATLERSYVVVVPCLAALGAYALVYTAARYLAPFIVALFLALAAAFPREASLRAGRLVLGGAIALLLIDAFSLIRDRVFLTYALALFIPAWFAWRGQPTAQRSVAAMVTAMGMLLLLSLLPVDVVRLAVFAGGVMGLVLSRQSGRADLRFSDPALRRSLALWGVVASLTPGIIVGLHALDRWRKTPSNATHPEWTTALLATRQGAPRGSRIALVGSPFEVGWARLARYEIVAVVPDAQVEAFWALGTADREKILRVFGAAGAQALVAKPRQ